MNSSSIEPCTENPCDEISDMATKEAEGLILVHGSEVSTLRLRSISALVL